LCFDRAKRTTFLESQYLFSWSQKAERLPVSSTHTSRSSDIIIVRVDAASFITSLPVFHPNGTKTLRVQRQQCIQCKKDMNLGLTLKGQW
jgi:hypothetical protein